MKICPSCQCELPADRFTYGYKQCKLCVGRRTRANQKIRRKERNAGKFTVHPRAPERHFVDGVLMEKACTKCKQMLSSTAFNGHPTNKDGYTHHCRSCLIQQWREKIDGRRIPILIARCKKVAKDKRLPFNLTVEDIVIPTHCPVLGLPLEFGKTSTASTWRENSPSLDRIIPDNGYVKGNVIVVSYRANRIKNDATVQELIAVAKFYKDLM